MIRIIKKKNPTDKNFLNQIEIKKDEIWMPVTDNILIKYHIYYKNKLVGYFKLTKGYNYIDNMHVIEKYKRRGLATFMHKYIEKDLGIKIVPSEDLTDDGEEFYKSYSK